MQNGFRLATRGGISIAIDDMLVPPSKSQILAAAEKEVKEIEQQYTSGLVTQGERYNKVVDIWSKAGDQVAKAMMDQLATEDVVNREGLVQKQESFNAIYMMADSGARGSATQIRQLAGMRGLMAKPDGSIIETPITANFREGLNVLQYFISTHGARKGLADTALKTADAGYLTRRLVDVSQDVIINTEDCGTLRGIEIHALKKNEEVIETLGERVLGRVALNDVINPLNEEVIVSSGEEIREDAVEKINQLPIESIEVRSALTCEAKHGICAKCYGRNLSTGKMVQIGEAVGVVAAQSIGEPGTQLTLRTFHMGGTAGNISEENKIIAHFDGILEIDDLKTVKGEDYDGNSVEVVISRTSEVKILEPHTRMVLSTSNIPYGSFIFKKNGDSVKKGDVINQWDPYNAVIISEFSGQIAYENIEQGVTFQVEIDEQTGFQEKVISESRNKRLIPTLHIQDKNGNILRSYTLPLGAHIMVDDKEKIKEGRILVKIPRKSAKSGDITGGLPRVTELFEARNPSNPAIVAEIDGVVSFGKVKRGNREIYIESKTGEKRTYLVKLSSQVLVQENDYVRAGMPLSDGSVTPEDILRIKGPSAVQQYLVNEVQEVYRLQGVKINDKHFEVVVRQMMRKVEIQDPGDTLFLEEQMVHKDDFIEENDKLFGKKVVEDAGDSQNLKPGQIVTMRQLRDENSLLKRQDKRLVIARDIIPATAVPVLQGITRASLQTKSFISAASFQETTKVLNEAAVQGKVDNLDGLKENVIVGHRIPAGTGMKRYENIIVGSRKELAKQNINL